MITPPYTLNCSVVCPKLELDFTNGILDQRITFSRALNTATYTSSLGIITQINANLPRFDFDPTTLACKGLLIEESRKNILLNSLINGTNLSTQSVTTSAVNYTLSFYGTGSIVLSGTSTGTISGTGNYPSRKTYTFTPTAGTLTLTVSGTVQYAQLEAGTFATSFIPTDSTAGGITRNADVATMTGTNFSSWYNASEGTFEVNAIRKAAPTAGKYPYALYLISTAGNDFNIYQNGATSENALIRVGSVNQANMNSTVVAANTPYNQVVSYKVNSFASCVNAGTLLKDNSGSIPTLNTLYIGAINTTGYEINGWISKIKYWNQRVTDNEVQSFSKN